MKFKNKTIKALALLASLSFSANAYALEISNVKANSALGEPVNIDVIINGDGNFSASEASSDTYDMFETYRDNYNDNIKIIRDSQNKNIFHLKGDKKFTGTVFDMIINFKKEGEDVNFYKRIIKEVEFIEKGIIKENVKNNLATNINNKIKKNKTKEYYKHKFNTNLKSNKKGFYTVKQGNTLYGIASKVHKKIKLNTVVLSSWIFENNKKAFVNNNPNMLKQYYDIKIPNKKDIKGYKTSKEEALHIIKTGKRSATKKIKSFSKRIGISDEDISKYIKNKKTVINKSKGKDALPFKTSESGKKDYNTKALKLVTPTSTKQSDDLVNQLTSTEKKLLSIIKNTKYLKEDDDKLKIQISMLLKKIDNLEKNSAKITKEIIEERKRNLELYKKQAESRTTLMISVGTIFISLILIIILSVLLIRKKEAN